MKKQTNCPNCGAPIDIHRKSCEYCGTPYEKSNDIHIEVTAPDPSVEDFAEVLSRISRRSGFNFMDSPCKSIRAIQQDLLYSQVRQSIQATQQELLSGISSATAWKPTPEEERKMIEDMRNVAPMIFPKTEPSVEYVKQDKLNNWYDRVVFLSGLILIPFIIFLIKLMLAAK